MILLSRPRRITYFYSRPCGRGDVSYRCLLIYHNQFLLTPLREGRLPATAFRNTPAQFLLTPLREGRPSQM